MTNKANPPKLFISYSWSDHDHEQWVINLATELRESGVDVILDKWDLKEGHDSVFFMEKMVTDQTISKVAIISDKTYAEKADGRSGGVGTETQIISREVYEKQSQEKFVAIIPSKNEDGRPYLPTYYKGRIYIDLSESDKYAENFEKLLRWIYNQPLLVKPEIGSKPAFLNETGHISLGTTTVFKRSIEALRTNKPFAVGSIDEYFSIFVDNLEKYRIEGNGQSESDQLIVDSIEKFIPHRNELIQLFITIAQYQPTKEVAQKIHRFFENLIPYTERPAHITQYYPGDFDNFKFIVHELFLYAVGIFIKYEQFEFANELLVTPYYLGQSQNNRGDPTTSFNAFYKHMSSLENRNSRLSLNRLSLRADLLKDRAQSTGIEFSSLMQADFVLFLRSVREGEYWWPETLVYSTHSHNPFEIFARSISKKYFDKVKILLNVNTTADLENLLSRFTKEPRRLPHWQFDSIHPKLLLGFDNLSTKP